MAQTRVAFRRVAGQWGAAQDAVDRAYDDLVARYGEPHRHHHTLEHLGEVLALVEGTEVELAAWYHDVIYDPRAGDNEARSAAHAREVLLGLGAPEEVVAEVERLIMTTVGHDADDPRGRALVDADLAILTADRERYVRYARAVRAEYAHLDDDTWRRGRINVLQSLRAAVGDDSNLVWELGTLTSP